VQVGKSVKKWLYIIGVLVITIVAISVVFIVIDSKNSAKVDIMVAPLSAEIKIGDKIYKNGTYGFEPGEIDVTISKEGFEPESRILTLESGATTKLYVYLTPLEWNKNWYYNNREDMMLMMAIGDANADIESKAYSEKNPIIGILPIIYAKYDDSWDYTEFRIDGGGFEECSRDFCLKITDTTGGNYENALQLIKEKGYNADDFEIIYEHKPVTPLK